MKIKGNLRVLQKALILRKDHYLFIQRSADDENNPNKWDLPGGKIDWGENPQEALMREIKEETNLEVSNLKPKTILSFNLDNLFAVAIIYQVKWKAGTVKLSFEHQNFQWISRNKVKKLDVQWWIKDNLNKIINDLK